MAKRKSKKVKVNYVQLEASAFLSDEDFQMFTAEERGIYCTIIFYMLCNNGRIKNDIGGLQRLCNVSADFEQKWDCVSAKFYQKGAWLRHRRVDVEIKKAKIRLQRAVEAGLKGAQAKWGSYSNPNGKPLANENEGNRSEIKVNISNSKRASVSVSNSFRFVIDLEKIIQPKNQSDRTAIKNLDLWLAGKINNNQFDDGIYKRVLAYAKESKAGRNPMAVFFATLKRELNYSPILKG